jgi:hypothetical protein
MVTVYVCDALYLDKAIIFWSSKRKMPVANTTDVAKINPSELNSGEIRERIGKLMLIAIMNIYKMIP